MLKEYAKIMCRIIINFLAMNSDDVIQNEILYMADLLSQARSQIKNKQNIETIIESTYSLWNTSEGPHFLVLFWVDCELNLLVMF